MIVRRKRNILSAILGYFLPSSVVNNRYARYSALFALAYGALLVLQFRQNLPKPQSREQAVPIKETVVSRDADEEDHETAGPYSGPGFKVPDSVYTLSKDGIFWSSEMESLYESDKVYFDDETEKEKLRKGKAANASTVLCHRMCRQCIDNSWSMI